MVERRTGSSLTQVRFPDAGRNYSPRVNFQCRLFYGVRTPPYAITCINICAHVKDHVVRIRVRRVMETLKHSACTVGWVARLCHSWLSLGRATRITLGRNPNETTQLLLFIRLQGTTPQTASIALLNQSHLSRSDPIQHILFTSMSCVTD